MKSNVLYEKSLLLAIRVVKLYKYLCSNNEYVMSKQLLRCGTSIGANIAESMYGQSVADFINKLSIAQKETSEMLYWLDLLHRTEYLEDKEYESIDFDAVEMMKMLTSSIKTAKLRINQ